MSNFSLTVLPSHSTVYRWLYMSISVAQCHGSRFYYATSTATFYSVSGCWFLRECLATSNARDKLLMSNGWRPGICEHPTMHRTATVTTQNCLVQNVHSAKVEKPHPRSRLDPAKSVISHISNDGGRNPGLLWKQYVDNISSCRYYFLGLMLMLVAFGSMSLNIWSSKPEISLHI